MNEPKDEIADESLVAAAVQGDRNALDQLLRRHQGFFYSLAQRILYSPEDAADATQEILVRLVTHLASFRGEAQFRTWATKIAVRQLLAFRKARVEQVVTSFSCFAHTIDATPDLDLPDEGTLPVSVQLVVEEAKIGCLMAMMLCLDREHRIAFALAEILEASDTVGAEALEITPDNFRQRVTRARQQLRQFLAGRCGLIDAKGTCHCARKTKDFIRQGIVDPAKLQFTPVHLDAVRTAAVVGAPELQNQVERAYAQLLRTQPEDTSQDFASILRSALERPEVRKTLAIRS